LRNLEAWLIMKSSSHGSHVADLVTCLALVDFVEANFGGCCSATWAYPNCVFFRRSFCVVGRRFLELNHCWFGNEVWCEQINFHTHKIWCCADR
jgi:hypothetical protein